MAGLEDLSDNRAPHQRMFNRLGRAARQPQMGNTAISRGDTTFIGNESLLVEGSQKVSGWLVVTGTLKVVGTFLLEGVTTITGALTARGTTRFEGDTTQVGPLGLEGTMTVKPGGKVIVQGALPAVLEDGALSFSTGAKLKADSTGAMLHAGSTQSNVRVGNGAAAVQFGTALVSCEADGVYMSGLGIRLNAPVNGVSITGPITAPLPLKSGAAANVHVDAAGKFWRTS